MPYFDQEKIGFGHWRNYVVDTDGVAVTLCSSTKFGGKILVAQWYRYIADNPAHPANNGN
jgi:hypothetical protein